MKIKDESQHVLVEVTGGFGTEFPFELNSSHCLHGHVQETEDMAQTMCTFTLLMGGNLQLLLLWVNPSWRILRSHVFVVDNCLPSDQLTSTSSLTVKPSRPCHPHPSVTCHSAVTPTCRRHIPISLPQSHSAVTVTSSCQLSHPAAACTTQSMCECKP